MSSLNTRTLLASQKAGGIFPFSFFFFFLLFSSDFIACCAILGALKALPVWWQRALTSHFLFPKSRDVTQPGRLSCFMSLCAPSSTYSSHFSVITSSDSPPSSLLLVSSTLSPPSIQLCTHTHAWRSFPLFLPLSAAFVPPVLIEPMPVIVLR